MERLGRPGRLLHRQRADVSAPRRQPDPNHAVRHHRRHRGVRARVPVADLPRRLRPAARGVCARRDPRRAVRQGPPPGRARPRAGVGDRVHVDVHARRLDAPHRQHAVPVDLREQTSRTRWGTCGSPSSTSSAGCSRSSPHAAPNAVSQVPLIGASGAVSGVLGAYLLLYPHARVLVVIPFGFLLHSMRVRAVWVLGGWFVLQLINSVAMGSTGGGVAWSAHVGGFLAGAVLIPLLQASERHPVRSRAESVQLRQDRRRWPKLSARSRSIRVSRGHPGSATAATSPGSSRGRWDARRPSPCAPPSRSTPPSR